MDPSWKVFHENKSRQKQSKVKILSWMQNQRWQAGAAEVADLG